MKKITALLLSIAIITSLSACGEKNEETASTIETTEAATTPATHIFELDEQITFKELIFNISSKWEVKETSDKMQISNPVDNSVFSITAYPNGNNAINTEMNAYYDDFKSKHSSLTKGRMNGTGNFNIYEAKYYDEEMSRCYFGCIVNEDYTYVLETTLAYKNKFTVMKSNLNEILSSIQNIEDVTEPTEEATLYELDTEYSFHDISFNICSEWIFADGEAPTWYANSTSYAMAACDIIEGATYFDFQEYVNAIDQHSEIKVKKSTPITLFENTDAIKIEMVQTDYNVNIIQYSFMIEDKLYSISTTDDILNYAEKIIETIQIKQQEIEATEEKVPVYQSNMYKVGVDIDAGEYMLFAESELGGYVCVSSDANQDDIIYNDNFGNNLIATFEDGEYVDLSRCFAIPYDKVTADISELIKDYIDEGAMYKVGTNLEAGEYKLEATDDYGGYYCIYSDSRHDYIIANDNFDNNTYVSVSDGEYLLLSRCKIIE